MLLRRPIPTPTPIVIVAGNHEFYRSCLPDELAQACVADHGVTFLGATLWTDDAIDGEAWRALANRRYDPMSSTSAYHAA